MYLDLLISWLFSLESGAPCAAVVLSLLHTSHSKKRSLNVYVFAMLLNHLCMVMSPSETILESIHAESKNSSPTEERHLQNKRCLSRNNLLGLLNDFLDNLLNDLVFASISLLDKSFNRVERQSSGFSLGFDFLFHSSAPRQPLV
jgi:hypothetical protein